MQRQPRKSLLVSEANASYKYIKVPLDCQNTYADRWINIKGTSISIAFWWNKTHLNIAVDGVAND